MNHKSGAGTGVEKKMDYRIPDLCIAGGQRREGLNGGFYGKKMRSPGDVRTEVVLIS